jgi:hypothetical protein
LTNVSRPNIYRTLFTSPQLELFELDDSEWLKILERPEYARRRKLLQALAKQLAFGFNLLLWLFFGP